MRKVGHLVLLLGLAVLVLSACRKEDGAGAPHGSPRMACDSISGIWMTDVNGALIAAGDTDDWGHTDAWCPEVEALFGDLPGVAWRTDEPDTLMIGAWPNPTTGQFVMAFDRDSLSLVDFRFVNAGQQLLLARDSMPQHHIVIDAGSLGLTEGELIRAYYRVVFPDGTAYRGHGDVQYQP